MSTGAFESGRDLNRAFYADVVRPLLIRWPHAAALLGWGSEVLGYDSPRSTDHGWGPRLRIFADEADVAAIRGAVEGLPETFRGHPTRFGWDDAPVVSRVEVSTVVAFAVAQIGADPTAMSELDWLGAPQQRILEMIRGEVYADPDGRLAAMRSALTWYPDPVWRWLLACQWRRIGQEEAFVGRADEAGDALGSALIAGRLVGELMGLAFLLERRYAPYTKWFGTAFAELDAAAELRPQLLAAQRADAYPARETALATAYEIIGRRHNALRISEAVDPATRPFYSRPYRVMSADRFADACLATIDDSPLRRLPPIGAIDQWVDSTDALGEIGIVRTAYEERLARRAK